MRARGDLSLCWALPVGQHHLGAAPLGQFLVPEVQPRPTAQPRGPQALPVLSPLYGTHLGCQTHRELFQAKLYEPPPQTLFMLCEQPQAKVTRWQRWR